MCPTLDIETGEWTKEPSSKKPEKDQRDIHENPQPLPELQIVDIRETEVTPKEKTPPLSPKDIERLIREERMKIRKPDKEYWN